MADTPTTIEVDVTTKPSAIRVLRVLEYIYPDVETMVDDRAHWAIQGLYRPRRGMTIRSTVMVPEMVPPVETNDDFDHMAPAYAYGGCPLTPAQYAEITAYLAARVRIPAADD